MASDAIPCFPPVQTATSVWIEALKHCTVYGVTTGWDVITGGNNDGRNYLQLSLLHSLQFSVLQTRTAAYCHGACSSTQLSRPSPPKAAPHLQRHVRDPRESDIKKKRKRSWRSAGKNGDGRKSEGGNAGEKERGCDCQQHAAVITLLCLLTCSLQTCLTHLR